MPLRLSAFAAAVFGAASLALFAAVAVPAWSMIGSSFSGFLVWDNGVLVSLHRESWTGARAGLPLNGGIVERVDGEIFGGGRAFVETAHELPVGHVREIVVRRDGATATFRVATMTFGWRDFASTFGIYLFNALALLAVGFVCLRLRSDLPAARALALATGLMGALLLLAVDYVSAYRFTYLCRAVEAAAPASLLLLALRFPSELGSPLQRRVAVVGLAGVGLAVHLLAFRASPELSRMSTTLVYGGIALSLVALLANCFSTLRQAREPKQRIVAGIVFAGWVPAFALAAAGMLSFVLFGWSFSWAWALALLPLAPAATAYAILRHDLLQAERFARISTGYTIATGLLFLLFAGTLTALEQFFVHGFAASPLAALAVLVAVAFAFDPLRRRVQRGIDRFFYQARLDVARQLEILSTELAAVDDEAGVARVVEGRLREALQVRRASVRWGEGAGPGATLSETMRVGEERLGTIECGAKRSGAPFSPDEREFLRGVAAQTAVALRGARARHSLRDAQRDLLRRTRLAAIGEFAGTVAHGIRNPLSGIRLAAQAAQAEIAGGEISAGRMAKAFEGVVDEADRLERRVRALLQFSQRRESAFQPEDLCEVLDEVVAGVRARAERAGVEIRVMHPASPPRWPVDRPQLVEALLELATNAIRAMPEGGELRLELHDGPPAPRFRVRDTGAGVPEADRERIFELAYTTNPDGMGLGLTRVAQLAELHGGALVLEEGVTEPGAAFQFVLGAPGDL